MKLVLVSSTQEVGVGEGGGGEEGSCSLNLTCINVYVTAE